MNVILANKEGDASIRIDETEEGKIRFNVDDGYVAAEVTIEKEHAITAFQRFVVSKYNNR